MTNTHTPGTVDVPVTKVWDDNSDQDGLRPDDLAITLSGTDGSSRQQVLSGSGDTWSHTFTGLPKYYNGGIEIVYTMAEDEVPEGYTEAYSDDHLTVTNTHTPETVDIEVKKVWADRNDEDGVRPETLDVILTGSDGIAHSATLTGLTNTWTHTSLSLIHI